MGVPQNATDTINGANKATENLTNYWQDPKMIHYRMDGFVLATAMLLGSIMVLRAFRNRTGWSSIKFFLIAACYLSTHSLSYVLGRLGDNPFNSDMTGLVVVWAVFLIVLDGMTYNSGSESLEDNEEARKRFLWEKMIPSLWFFFILFWNFPIGWFWIPLLLLWVLYILKLSERKQALIYACKSRGGLDKVAMVIANYMENEHLQETEANPNSMHGYKYLVGVKHALKQVFLVSPARHGDDLNLAKIVTIDKIWECEGTLLDKSGDPDGHVKDTCLSFALFWLLLRRFADYELEELSSKESREKTWRFVRYGLIKEQEDEQEWERAFRIVEVELQFLCDFFFNNYFAVYYKGPRFLVVRMSVFVLHFFVTSVTVKVISTYKVKSQHWYDLNNLQIIVTQVIIYTLSLVELAQIINLITSRWNKVKWICSCVRRSWWQTRQGKLKASLLYMLCRAPCLKPWIDPWHRKLRQYSLLDSYGHVPIILKFKRILDGYMEFPMEGQKESKPVKLTDKVMKAVIFSLQTNGQTLSNGSASLKRNNVESLSWACKGDYKKTTQIILVWHIATTFCEIATTSASTNTNVAISISKYCAYLVAFAPKVLPTHVYTSQWLFESVGFKAKQKFKNCPSKESKYEEISSWSEESSGGTTLEQGALLGKKLIAMDESLRWKVLADFWAEMILYSAPSNDVAAHAEQLAAGGDFITHLWALLTNAGIVSRDE